MGQLQAVRAGYIARPQGPGAGETCTAAFADPDGREPGRTIELHLTGHMDRYVWSFNGVKFSDSAPLEFTHGERLRDRAGQ